MIIALLVLGTTSVVMLAIRLDCRVDNDGSITVSVTVDVISVLDVNMIMGLDISAVVAVVNTKIGDDDVSLVIATKMLLVMVGTI